MQQGRETLLFLHLFLGAVGINDGGVLQMALQVAGDGIDVDSSQFGTFFQFCLRQTLSLVLVSQFVDSLDNFVHVHISYLIHTGE